MCTDRLLCICVFRVKCLKTRQRLRQSDLSQNLLDLQPGSTYRSNVHIAVKRSHSLNLCTILHHPNFILVHFNDFIIYLYLYLYIIYISIYLYHIIYLEDLSSVGGAEAAGIVDELVGRGTWVAGFTLESRKIRI